MAKKYIPIIAGIVAVIAIIVIAIIGSNPDIRNKNVYVNSISITTQHYDTFESNGEIIKRFFMTDDNTEIVEGKYTFKLDYTVTPENATNKTVTFTSSDNTIATVDSNGLVTFERKDAVFITLTSNDGTQKTAKAQLVWVATVDAGFEVKLNQDDNLEFNTLGDTKFFEVENDTLYLYKGMKYVLSSDAEVDISQTDIAEFEDGVLKTNSMGELSLTFKFGETTKTQKIEIVEYINIFQVGTSYSQYQQTVNSLNDETVSLNYLDKTIKPYEVGTNNSYYFDITIHNNDNEPVSLKDAHLVYQVYEINDEEQKSKIEDSSTVFSINENGTLSFKTASIGKTYEVQVLPKYNFTNKQALTFKFVVVEGYNIFSHEELKTYFSDLTVNNIILHSNIIVKADKNQLDPSGRLFNYSDLTMNNGVTGDIYTRLYTENDLTTYKDNLDISIYGNYFKIDASNVPYLTIDSNYSSHPNLSWTEDSGYPCASVQTAIFKVQEITPDAYNTGVAKTDIINFNIDSLKLEGNTSTGIIYETDDLGKPIIPDDEAQVIANQGSSSAAFMGRGAVKVNTNNVVILKAFDGIYVTGSFGGISTNYTLINDSWANAIFGWRTTSFDLRNSTFSKAGGAAICITDATITDAYSEEWMDATVTFGPNVIVDNYVSGTEGYFIVNNLSTIVPQLKGQLNPQIEQIGKTLLKDETIEGKDYTVFNFVFQFGKEGNNYEIKDYNINNVGANDGWRTYVSGMWLVRNGEYLVNENNPNEKYAITGTNSIIDKTVDSQLTMNFFDGYENGNQEKYIQVRRQSGYFSNENNPVTSAFGGISLAGVSKISNVSDALLVGGVVGGYITADDFVSDIGADNGTSQIATLLNGEATLIEAGKALGLNLTSTKSIIKQKITALGTNLTTGLQAFATLDDVSKIVYLCDYELLNNIKTNIETFKVLKDNPLAADYKANIEAIIAGFEATQKAASTNPTLVQATVAITANNDMLEIKEEAGTLNLVEVKINLESLGDFSGILIYAGIYPNV